MARRMHPFVVNLGRSGPESNVFFNQAEMRARLSGPLRQVRLASVAMRDRPLRRHPQAVLAGSLGQRSVPLQPPGSGLRARPIGQRKQLLGRRRASLVRPACALRMHLRQSPARSPRQHQTQNQTLP